MKLQQKVAAKTVSDLTNLTNICIYSVLPEEYQTDKDALLAYRLPPNDFGRWYYAMCRANDKLNFPGEGEETQEVEWTKMQLKTAVIERFPYEKFKTTSNKKKTINKKLLAELQSTGLLFADVTKNRLYIMSRYALPTLGQTGPRIWRLFTGKYVRKGYSFDVPVRKFQDGEIHRPGTGQAVQDLHGHNDNLQ